MLQRKVEDNQNRLSHKIQIYHYRGSGNWPHSILMNREVGRAQKGTHPWLDGGHKAYLPDRSTVTRVPLKASRNWKYYTRTGNRCCHLKCAPCIDDQQ